MIYSEFISVPLYPRHCPELAARVNLRSRNFPGPGSWQDLKDHMKQAGEVAYCDIIPEKGSTLSSGSGLVEFQTAQMARTAISQLNNSELDGWKIHVREERTGLSIGQGKALDQSSRFIFSTQLTW
eukprot:SAG31_NODE_875_length_11316_cov_8.924044_6_plen_126_part_00